MKFKKIDFIFYFCLEKVILRIKKQEQDVDIEGKDTSTDEETV